MEYLDQHVAVEKADQDDFLGLKKMIVEACNHQARMVLSMPHGAILDHKCFQKMEHLETAVVALQAAADLCSICERRMHKGEWPDRQGV